MSRARLFQVLALLGILITTGGCADSATAPEAVAGGPAYGKVVRDTSTTLEGDVTITSGGFLPGGGRTVDGALEP